MSSDASLEIVCTRVTKRYDDGRQSVTALEEFSDRFAMGDVIAVTGPSGSGKSTLLALLAAIEYADGGTIEIGGTELGSLSTVEQAEFRGTAISYLYPDYNLLPMLSVYENISLALSLKRLGEAEIDLRIRTSLEQLDLSELAHRRPFELSSGQRARAGVARAIAMDNPILIADEPTAHLDGENAGIVADLLADVASDGKHIVVLATHDPAVARHTHRLVRLRSESA